MPNEPLEKEVLLLGKPQTDINSLSTIKDYLESVSPKKIGSSEKTVG